MALNEREYQLLSFMEQEYLISGFLPSKEVCLKTLRFRSDAYDALLKREDFKNALLARGISLSDDPNGVLTAIQLATVNTLLDRNDNRSDKKKLADLKVSTQTYEGWCRDPAFQDYMQRRTEALYGDALTEANRAIYDNVRRGDLGSIKLLFEMTGRWSSKPVSEMNIEWVLMKVVEVLQKHITDSDKLLAIATELSGIQQEAIPVAAGLPRGLNSGSLVPARQNTDGSSALKFDL